MHILRSPRDEDEVVDRFDRDATAAGYRDNGAPGERSVYHRLLRRVTSSTDGNNIEVVNHDPLSVWKRL